jgi:cytochrome b pre-mRNA-processing protein 3
MLALHLFLVLNRLRIDGTDAVSQSLAQALTDRLIADADANLREMGAGDLGVGRRVRRMAEGFNGRLAAYDAGLAGGTAVLAQAIRRNVYGTTEPTVAQVAAMAAYVQASRDALVPVPVAELAQGAVRFAAIPAGQNRSGGGVRGR